MSLYSNTAEQAASRAVRSRGAKEGLTAEQLDQLDDDTRKNILPLLDGFGLDDHQVGEITGRAIHIAIEYRTGRLTDAHVQAWDQLVYADMRAHGLTNKRIGAKLEELNERLFDEKPTAHAALAAAYPLGHHPRIQRMLMSWHDRRTAEDGLRSRSVKARMTPPSGTLRGSGAEGAEALKQLGKSPLGADDAA